MIFISVTHIKSAGLLTMAGCSMTISVCVYTAEKPQKQPLVLYQLPGDTSFSSLPH